MNYRQIQKMATAGIKNFSDDNGWFDIIISGGGKKVVGGKEVITPEERGVVKGAIRDVNDRDVNGESILAGDKRGLFTCDQEIKQGMRIIIDGELYTVVNARAIKPTGTVIAYRPILRRVAVPNG
ncbi:hypothetical protein [Enterobacter phage Phc]|nr:hypothetical protein [Enterobacter phage Phc]